MANEENLNRIRSGDEAREKGRTGGIASGVSRRRKKAVKKRLQEALSLTASSPMAIKALRKAGMDEAGTNYDAVVASIVNCAIQGKPGYAKLLMELIGETGEEKRRDRADRRDAQQLRMEKERLQMEKKEFDLRHSGDSEDNDMVLKFIDGMKGGADDPAEQ